jgi:UDP-N-acetylmuramate--alanine ligase
VQVWIVLRDRQLDCQPRPAATWAPATSSSSRRTNDDSFLQYPAEIAVVTNVDPDHLSNWGTAENYADGFLRFATGGSVRLLVVSADDPGASELTRRVREQSAGTGSGPAIVTFGENESADVRILEPSFAGTGSSFSLQHLVDGNPAGGPVRLVCHGHYNVLNAAASYAVASWLSVATSRSGPLKRQYAGTNRRFQLVGTVNGIRVYDDYAHHPTRSRTL